MPARSTANNGVSARLTEVSHCDELDEEMQPREPWRPPASSHAVPTTAVSGVHRPQLDLSCCQRFRLMHTRGSRLSRLLPAASLCRALQAGAVALGTGQGSATQPRFLLPLLELQSWSGR